MRKKERTRKTSLAMTLIILFSTILIAVVVLNLAINALLLERVYVQNKIAAMVNFYEELSVAEDLDETVRARISYDNMRVFIWDEDGELIVDSIPMTPITSEIWTEANKPSDEKKPGGNNPGGNKPEGDNPQGEGGRERGEGSTEPPEPKERPTERKQPEVSDGMSGGERDDLDESKRRSEMLIFDLEVNEDYIIKQTDDYSVISFSDFSSTDSYSLYLRGYFEDGKKVLLQNPVSPVKESAAISTSLSLVVGVIMLILGIIIVSLVSGRIAKPVKEMSKMALAMCNLDFSKKYAGKRTDEIGELGRAINELSSKLEATIDELYEKNERLRADNELKSQIDTMRKEFIANASHELKTPVALISGYAEGLRDNVASDEETRRMYTDVIIDETEKMDNIIHQMLDLMEIEGTEREASYEKISMKDLAEDVISSCSVLAENENVNVKLECSGEVVVKGEYWRIYQAVMNYLTNALNHVDDKKDVVVTLKEDGGEVYLGVYNSGGSIPQEETEKIWERFYKVDKARTREYGGTGLGLSIVKSIVKNHGGKCGVVNHPQGVEFYFTLPSGEDGEQL
ncbi:MAG: HAMP domain-containing histidine kinase [Clostridia bacterium]|nr:HAMP domain-containing histidine kinase [Clostridia bacterium]